MKTAAPPQTRVRANEPSAAAGRLVPEERGEVVGLAGDGLVRAARGWTRALHSSQRILRLVRVVYKAPTISAQRSQASVAVPQDRSRKVGFSRVTADA